MTLEPALSAPLPVQLHLLTVLPAFVIGLWLILFSTKGKLAHRTFGYIYLALMSVTALTTVFINGNPDGGFYGFSWIHLFIPLTIHGLWRHKVSPCAQPRGPQKRNDGAVCWRAGDCRCTHVPARPHHAPNRHGRLKP